jgi:type II secretory pathway component GspD/PulD (secretin)
MSLSSVKTKAWEELQLTRNIRPYRMAVIQVTQTGTNVPTIRTVFSEFGNGVLSTPARASAGIYSFVVTPSVFKNVNNVSLHVEPSNSTLANSGLVGILSGLLNSSNTSFKVVSSLSSGPTAAVDFNGRFNIIIKEYYR